MTNIQHARWDAAKPGTRDRLEVCADRGISRLKDQGYTIGNRIVDTEMCIKYEVWRDDDTEAQAAVETGRGDALFAVTPMSTLPELRLQFPPGEYWDALLEGLSPTRIYAALVRIEEIVSEGLPLRETMLSVMRGIARIQRNAKRVEASAD